ncbi:NAD(P)/FAD-dependent oxidoreductase [Kordia sp.]|uniref:NAD(P)/FAD-dependent oxidoreductase n=1 Tax=Kordia sp. TaxID=1965332 RepID=UPI003D6A166F
MENTLDTYDCIIIGGGIAGLSLSIQLSIKQRNVLLIEKGNYPSHKVCGEYISNESISFLNGLGLEEVLADSPKIDRLFLSSPSGISVRRKLDIGGIGISRYKLDYELYLQAKKTGVDIKTDTKVTNITREGHGAYSVETSKQSYQTSIVIGAFGKNSSIDKVLGLNYKAKNKKNLYVAVKYHIKADFDTSVVEMHNFEGGYCGISSIEDDKINLSYITKASAIKKFGSIEKMEKHVLSKNPHLRKYFEDATFLFKSPLTISHLHFGTKKTVVNDIIMIGDSAGNIAPLSGNGMSIALKSSQLAFNEIERYFNSKISYKKMTDSYNEQYNIFFKNRISHAKFINLFFLSPFFSNIAFAFLKIFPKPIDWMSKKIRGDHF